MITEQGHEDHGDSEYELITNLYLMANAAIKHSLRMAEVLNAIGRLEEFYRSQGKNVEICPKVEITFEKGDKKVEILFEKTDKGLEDSMDLGKVNTETGFTKEDGADFKKFFNIRIS